MGEGVLFWRRGGEEEWEEQRVEEEPQFQEPIL
jgi:hypothetical protein